MVKLAAVSIGGEQAARAPAYAPNNLSLLSSRLSSVQKAAQGGNPLATTSFAKAQDIARRGSPSIAGRALGAVTTVLGAPMRAVVGAVEEVGEGLTGSEDEFSWWERFTDPEFGTGKVVERIAPDAPMWVKRAAGLAGDITLDPLNWIVPGASLASKAAGKGAGLAKIAVEAADYSTELSQLAKMAGKLDDADKLIESTTRMQQIATKAGKGMFTLSDTELDDLAYATRLMAEDPQAAHRAGRAFKAGELGYGINVEIPFTDKGKTLLSGPISQRYGRGMDMLGNKITSRLRSGRLGDMLGGNAGRNAMKQALASGDYGTVRAATRSLAATDFMSSAMHATERQMTDELNVIDKTLTEAGLSGQDITAALRERSVNGRVAGDAWDQVVAGNPQREAALKAAADWLDARPEFAAEAAAYGMGDKRVKTHWLADAAERDRPYFPRVPTQEFADAIQKPANRKAPRRPGAKAGFEMRGYAPGDEFMDTKLVVPGETLPDGTRAPSLEIQQEEIARAQLGDEAVGKMWEDDFYSVIRGYSQRLARQIGNQKAANYLQAKGIVRPLTEWVPGENGITVKAYHKNAVANMERLEGKVQSHLDALDAIRVQKDEARQAVAAGKLSVQDYQQLVGDLDAHAVGLRDQVRKSADEVELFQRQHGERLAQKDAADDARDLVELDLDDAKVAHKTALDALNAELDRVEATGKGWENLVELQGRVDEAKATLRRTATKNGRAVMIYEEAANNMALAKEMRERMAADYPMQPTNQFTSPDEIDPLGEMLDEAMLRYGITDQEQLAQMLEGQAERQLSELAGLTEGDTPSTINPQRLRAEIGVAEREKRNLLDDLLNSPEGWQRERVQAAYERASVRAQERRNLLTVHKQAMGGPTFLELDEVQRQAMNDMIAAQTAVQSLGATPQEQVSASFAYAQEQWAQTVGPEVGPISVPNGGTWYHGWRDTPVSVDGQVPLESFVEHVGSTWADNLFRPSTTPDFGFAENWIEGLPGRVQEMVFNSVPERVRVYGMGNSPNRWQLSTEIGGDISEDVQSAMYLDQMAGDQLLGDSAVKLGGGGPSYSVMITDFVTRMSDERPDLINRFIEEAWGRGTRRSDAARSADDAIELATKLQAFGTAQGVALGFDDAMEMAGRWTKGFNRSALDFNYDEFDHMVAALPDPDDYKPYASALSQHIIGRQGSDALRVEMYDTIRQSMARDYDVLVFANLHDSPDRAFVMGMPTNQFTMEPGQVPGQNVSTALSTVQEARRAYTGKFVDPDLYDQLQSELTNASDAMRSLNDQFTARMDDADRLDRLVGIAERAEGYAIARNVQDVDRYRNSLALLREAREAVGVREAQVDENLARVANLHAREREMAASLNADLLPEFWTSAMQLDQATKYMDDIMHAGYEGFGFARQAPNDVVDWFSDYASSFDPLNAGGFKPFLKKWDDAHSWLKSWLLAMPGTQIRNIFGGMFNNHLARADVVGSLTGWGNIMRKFTPKDIRKAEAAGAVLGTPWEQSVYRINDQLGILGGGLFRQELEGITKASWNPMAGITGSGKSFQVPYAMRKATTQATEPLLRGSLAYDRIVKAVEQGRFASIGIKRIEDIADDATAQLFSDTVLNSPLAEEIMADIAKYHFDYEDLSKFESQVGKRIIPFYTWTRKNVPLQLEAMFTEPGRSLNRYMAVKRNLELGSEEEDIVPGYFGEQGMIRLPWGEANTGTQRYAGVDLPFKDPFKVMDVTGQLSGMVSPLIKAPLEAWGGEQFNTGVPITGDYKPVPGVWAATPGLMQAFQALAKLPFFPTDAPVKQGDQWFMRGTDSYLVEQYAPFMGQIRRLLPYLDEGGTESRNEARLWTTMATSLFGVSMRTNTKSDMEGELYRRSLDIGTLARDLKSVGLMPEAETRKARRVQGIGSGGAAPSLSSLLASVAAT